MIKKNLFSEAMANAKNGIIQNVLTSQTGKETAITSGDATNAKERPMLDHCQEINLLNWAQEHLLSNFLLLSKLTSQKILFIYRSFKLYTLYALRLKMQLVMSL